MARSIAEIDAEIAKTKEELENVHGTEAEVYARIVGYYRSVRNWNKGKREEYKERKMFAPSAKEAAAHIAPKEALDGSCACGNPQGGLAVAGAPQANVMAPSAFSDVKESALAHVELFARKACPNCPPVKEYVEGHFEKARLIDVDSAEGFARAQECAVLSTPTVIFYDETRAEIARAHSISEIKAIEAAILSSAEASA